MQQCATVTGRAPTMSIAELEVDVGDAMPPGTDAESGRPYSSSSSREYMLPSSSTSRWAIRPSMICSFIAACGPMPGRCERCRAIRVAMGVRPALSFAFTSAANESTSRRTHS